MLSGDISASPLKEKFESLTDTQRAVISAIRDPRQYVVKPQKEGGGNNFYDDEARDLLKQFINPSTPAETKESLKQYLIMERINPPMIKAWMLKDGQLNTMMSLSELGIYSYVVIDSANIDVKWSEENKKNMQKHYGPNTDELIQTNELFGTLMRTKGSHMNEGGVNAGFSVIDQPVLVDIDQKDMKEEIAANVDELPI